MWPITCPGKLAGGKNYTYVLILVPAGLAFVPQSSMMIHLPELSHQNRVDTLILDDSPSH